MVMVEVVKTWKLMVETPAPVPVEISGMRKSEPAAVLFRNGDKAGTFMSLLF
jgi:hypothetical protein